MSLSLVSRFSYTLVRYIQLTNERMDEPERRPIRSLFVVALGLMVAFMALKRIPAPDAQWLGFSVSKLLKVAFGIIFIVSGFVVYRHHTKPK